MGAIKPQRPCNDKADDLRLKQTLNRREKLSFLESHMCRHALAEAVQCFDIVLPQPIKQRTQLLMVCQGALHKRLHFRAAQKRQQRLLFNLEMRFQLISVCPDGALAGFNHQLLIAQLCGPFARLRQSKRGVMLAR